MEQTTQQVRLKNLRMLHGRVEGLGAPTSALLTDFLNGSGVSITSQDVSAIYRKEREIGDYLAGQIERAFELPSGWLGVDHEFVYTLNPGDAIVLRGLANLPSEIKSSLLALVTSISSSTSHT